MTIKVSSLSDLKESTPQIVAQFNPNKVVLFYGEMGAGKTTLIKEVCHYLGVEDVTSSPTFSLVNEYLTNKGDSIYHFDFYRIEDETEVMDMGYEDYFYSGNYCFIEWPEKIPNLIPENTVQVTITIDAENNRLISIAS